MGTTSKEPTEELLAKLAGLKTLTEQNAQDMETEGAVVLERKDIDELIEAARAVRAGRRPAYR